MDDSLSPARPTFVTILAIFTIIGTVMYFGWIGLTALVPELSGQEVDVPVWLTIGAYVTQLGKFVAAILLLKMCKIGFYLYAGLEVLSTICALLIGKVNMDYIDSSYVNPSFPMDPKVVVLVAMGMWVGMAILFVGGYATHLQKMR